MVYARAWSEEGRELNSPTTVFCTSLFEKASASTRLVDSTLSLFASTTPSFLLLLLLDEAFSSRLRLNALRISSLSRRLQVGESTGPESK